MPIASKGLLGLCVALWFLTSAVCTACGKITLTLLRPHAGSSCALTLTATQFAVSAIMSVSIALLLGRRPPAAYREVVLVSLAYTFGFLLLNCSLGRLQASFSETVRGLEPLTSFLLAHLLGARGARLSRASGGALLSVLSGAALSIYSQPAFDVPGFLYGLLANCAFSSRGLLVTLLQDATTRVRGDGDGGEKAGSIDPIGLFAAQHTLGLCILVPAAMLVDDRRCAASLAHDPWDNPATRAAALSALGFLAYNFLSLLVLLLIDAVSHSVCNTCRRAVTIVAAAFVFQNAISTSSAAGILLIIGGSAAYAIASAADRAGTHAAPGGQRQAATAEADALLEVPSDSRSDSGGEPGERVLVVACGSARPGA